MLSSLVCALAMLSTPAAIESYLGPDVLWRPREALVFHMLNEQGAGFAVTVTLRDMNTYMQGPRAAFFMITGPKDEVLARQFIEDDGVVSGNAQYHDGMHDVYADFRYREWHGVHSPGGYPPGKQRSPYLMHPERLPARTVHVRVPAAGKGLYRVTVQGCWDHWVSVSTDRPMPAGVHCGAGPMYVHGDRLSETYLYAPTNLQDIAVSVSEEVQPYNWRVQLEDPSGGVLAATRPRTFMSYMIHRGAKGGRVYRMRVTGKTTGACLHVRGLPPLFCPDAETARKLRGGLQIDMAGRVTYHHHQRVLEAWARSLKPADLRVNVAAPTSSKTLGGRRGIKLKDVAAAIDGQNVDPNSPDFGKANGRGLQLAVTTDDPDNPYRANPALVRRVLLASLPRLRMLNAFCWYDGKRDGPTTIEPDSDKLFTIPFRSQWYAMHGGKHVTAALAVKDLMDKALPSEVADAWKHSFRLWCYARALVHQGECSNQWCRTLDDMARACRLLDDPFALEILNRRIDIMTTPGGLGRACPDPTPYSTKSAVKYTYSVDNGMLGDGCLSDGLGFDSQYCIEQVSCIRDAWAVTQHPGFLRWWNPYFKLKTHLTLTKSGGPPSHVFVGTCSPTDINHRTRYYTHKCGLATDAVDKVTYADLWRPTPGVEPKRPWPCLEVGSFTRVIDNKYFFIKTPAYYAIAHGGPTNYDYMYFGMADVKDGSASLVGYTGMHYGGIGRKCTKPGGISAVFVPGGGPTLLCQNHNVMFSNVVWGRRRTPVCPKWEKGHVDPTIVSSGYAHPYVEFDERSRMYRKTETLTYAPLQVTRTIHFQDSAIAVTVDLLATNDLDLVELYECVPYFVDKRVLHVYGADLMQATRFTAPKPRTTTGKWPRGQEPADDLKGWPTDLPDATFRAVDIATESGIGSAFVFDRERTFRQTQPIRYRRVAAATGAFNLPLRPRMAAGSRQTVRYVIYSHNSPVTPADIQRIAATPGPAQ